MTSAEERLSKTRAERKEEKFRIFCHGDRLTGAAR